MNAEWKALLQQARGAGWVMEPQAREILRAHGLPVTRSVWARTQAEALEGARQVGYPLVAKVVSPRVIHKSDVGGVVVGIRSEAELGQAFERLAGLEAFAGVLIDEMAAGVELIVGSKDDPQFGPVVLVGLGGTSVEIYQDVAIRMAPLSPGDAQSALDALRGRKLLEGYRGSDPIHRQSLEQLLVDFSKLAFDLRAEVASIDLNPVFCNRETAVIADARFVLADAKASGTG